ncbi:hypothetical protein JKA74_08175 [Marivirga sp. S37H4]|uniref:Calx-beta domain-containing protein n=1 Tax=Marivirga aurantiaca TaxID=2802615 RepID=A0A934WY23_9BACT|nr:hypothetical protein [Marivirga aurantiaca]MBK6265011.1 hypothetical protein [Marivirga aurantiaca]
MKKLLYIVYIAILIPFLTGCFDEAGTNKILTEQIDGFVEIEEASGSKNSTKNIVAVPDGENVMESISIAFGGAVSSSAVEVTYEVDTEASTAIEGVDFVMITGNTVTIPSGEYTVPVEFEVIDDNLDPDNPVSIVFRITSSTVDILEKYSEAVVTLAVECPAPSSIYGTYNVVTTETSPAGCSGVTNVVEISEVDGSTVNLNFSDLTGGLYANCYGEDDNPGVVIYACGDLQMVDQPDVVYGGDIFNGSGSYNSATETLTISWSNGYGDAGTSVFTKQ